MQETVRHMTSPGPAWYAARTCHGQELGIKRRLEALGVEHFIPVGKRRNYRGKEKDRPLISCLVFIRATKKEACDLRVLDALPVNYLFDHVKHTMLTVPDKQMEDFMRILDCPLTEGGLMHRPLELGDRVRVTGGPLAGVEGNVLELQGAAYVAVGVSSLVYARARIHRAWLEKVKQ